MALTTNKPKPAFYRVRVKGNSAGFQYINQAGEMRFAYPLDGKIHEIDEAAYNARRARGALELIAKLES